MEDNRKDKIIKLVSKEQCTGCAACAFVCPKHCISMVDNKLGVSLPSIDYESCIKCKKCMLTCPGLNPVTLQQPIDAYAAWSNDAEQRRTSASGGLGAELYKNILQVGGLVAGAVQKSDFFVDMVLGNSQEDILKFKNSKYVFSSAAKLYSQIAEALRNNCKCLVIGLPCQIAAIKKIFRDNELLITADIVCHGTVPPDYLQQHIKALEKNLKRKARRMSFRDAEVASTQTFTFTLYDQNGCFYAERGQDNYNFGFQRGVTYRENCYNCPYACDKRCSDITLGDFKGVTPDPTGSDKVSSVLVNTPKGQKLINTLISQDAITAVRQNINVIIEADERLTGAHQDTKYHRMFVKKMKSCGYDFEKAITKVKNIFIWKLRINRILSSLNSIIKF